MENHLESIASSYDKGIELGRKGIDLYQNLPETITSDPDYPLFQEIMNEGKSSNSGRQEIKAYLSPEAAMNFIDLGCCLNLMFNGYDQWPSTYHGVDISPKTIELLREVATARKLSVGSLYCGSIHETPFADNYFDIGACIGVLEYFERDFVEKALAEAHRIMKPSGRFVLDVPDSGSPEFRMTAIVEEYLGRPDRFDLSAPEFEQILNQYFVIDKAEKVGPMVQYFLICRK